MSNFPSGSGGVRTPSMTDKVTRQQTQMTHTHTPAVAHNSLSTSTGNTILSTCYFICISPSERFALVYCVQLGADYPENLTEKGRQQRCFCGPCPRQLNQKVYEMNEQCLFWCRKRRWRVDQQEGLYSISLSCSLVPSTPLTIVWTLMMS